MLSCFIFYYITSCGQKFESLRAKLLSSSIELWLTPYPEVWRFLASTPENGVRGLGRSRYSKKLLYSQEPQCFLSLGNQKYSDQIVKVPISSITLHVTKSFSINLVKCDERDIFSIRGIVVCVLHVRRRRWSVALLMMVLVVMMHRWVIRSRHGRKSLPFVTDSETIERGIGGCSWKEWWRRALISDHWRRRSKESFRQEDKRSCFRVLAILGTIELDKRSDRMTDHLVMITGSPEDNGNLMMNIGLSKGAKWFPNLISFLIKFKEADFDFFLVDFFTQNKDFLISFNSTRLSVHSDNP